MIRNLVLDAYSALSYKESLDGPGVARTWLRPEDRRRLSAYITLRAYVENVARHFIVGLDVSREHREYGDPAMVVETYRDHVLGDSQEIVVEGAEGEEGPEQARQDELRAWADHERLPLKLLELETDAAALGDGVLLLSWDSAAGRCRLSVMDPGFYFPVLDDDVQSDYPRTVHFAWETDPDEAGAPTRLRRITYELTVIPPATVEDVGPLGRLRRVFAGERPDVVTLQPGDAFTREGAIGRVYPWDPPGSAPSTTTCLLTDVSWDLRDVLATSRIHDLSLDRATFARTSDGELLDRLDLRVDFIPVVHVPNTAASKEHYGRSTLARCLQVLDDLAATDTDAAAAAAVAGSPPIGVSGSEPERRSDGTAVGVRYEPGSVWYLESGGQISTVDTAAGLDALSRRSAALEDRLARVSRLTPTVLGKVDASDVPSGLALSLSFGPLQALIRTARLVRDEKYALLLKFVQRWHMAGGVMDGEVLPATITLGQHLPNDTAGLVDQVRQLRSTEPPLVSLETAMRMLADAGVPIDDLSEELARVEGRDFAGAGRLADATADEAAVRDYLGLEGDRQITNAAREALQVNLPPVGDDDDTQEEQGA